MSNNFFAYMSRMKLIRRWSLMKSMNDENIAEHSAQVAQFAHAIALIKNRVFGGDVDPNRIATIALYHEASEVITGDLPTPIKYYDPDIKRAYKNIEAAAEKRLLSTLPDELKQVYEPLISRDIDSAEYKIVKFADKICAYLKCLEELRGGNAEFTKAANTIKQDIDKINTPEVVYFMEKFIPSFELTLDEMEI
jgi:5'-deoxynucleotidase